MRTKNKQEILRQKVLELVEEYARDEFESEKPFIPGKTHIPVSGKVIGREEVQYAVDACLDGWFTTGRFAEQFEKKFAKKALDLYFAFKKAKVRNVNFFYE